MRGIRGYRTAGSPQGDLQLNILSALHGVISADDLVKPYDFSYVGLSPASITDHSARSDVRGTVADLLSQPFRLGMLLLSEPYLHACALSSTMSVGGPVVVFCSPRSSRRLRNCRRSSPSFSRMVEASRFSCGLTSLKGELERTACCLSSSQGQLAPGTCQQ